jgi:hypothetical protein
MLPVLETSLPDVEICTENTPPDKYLAGFDVEIMRNSLLMLFAKGSNLLDQNIRNSTSCLRNFAPEAGRGADIGFRLSFETPARHRPRNLGQCGRNSTVAIPTVK